jgi:trimethyllysine dioxygenase
VNPETRLPSSHERPSKSTFVPQKATVNAGKKPSKTSTKRQLPQLDQISSKEHGSSPSEVLQDLKVLQNEVHRIYENHRKLASTLSGPMHVRKEYGFTHDPTTLNAQIEVDNNKVSALGKTIPNIWLRDNCQCSSCMHETTKQRLQDTFAIPKDLSIKSASYTKDVSANKTKLSIEWSDGHKSTYTQPFLANAIANFETRASIRQGLVTPELWGSEISRQRATVSYSEAVRENMGPVLQNIVSRPHSHQPSPHSH